MAGDGTQQDGQDGQDGQATDPRRLGEFIRMQRQMADLSLRRLAAMTEVSNAYLSQVERGPVVGQRLGDRERNVREAIERASSQVVFIPTVMQLREALDSNAARCVLADSPVDVRDITRVLRSNANNFSVPLIASNRSSSCSATAAR